MLNRKQAAEILGLKPATLVVWAREGRGPKFYRVGRSCRYKREDVEAYLESCCAVGA